MTKPQPEEIEKKTDGSIRIRWVDGHEGVYLPKFLRLECHCAACIEEWSGKKIVTADDVPEDIHPGRLSPVGQYALHIDWSDGHSTGMYSFDFLRSICPCQVCEEGRSEVGSME